MKRSDVHSPSNLKPEDYRLAGFYLDHQPDSDEACEFLESRMDDASYSNGVGDFNLFSRDSLPEMWKDGNFHQRGTCDHCGAPCLYFAIFEHTPSGEHIATGLTCATKTFPAENAEHARKQLAADKARAVTLDENNKRGAEWLAENPDYAWIADSDHKIASSFWQHVRRKGALSEKQSALLFKLTEERRQRDRDASHECETGEAWVGEVANDKKRQRVTGVVVGLKEQENHYAYGQYVLKMMVECGDRKIWATVPSAIRYDIARGAGIAFTCTLDEKEPGFFIAKRPSKAEFLFYQAA